MQYRVYLLFSSGGITGFSVGGSLSDATERVEMEKEKYISPAEIALLFNKTTATIDEMKNAGLSTFYVNDLYIEMVDEAIQSMEKGLKEDENKDQKNEKE